MLSILFSLAIGVVIYSGISTAQGSTKSNRAKEVSYSKDVAPILGKFCVTCHTADDEHPSELYMDSYESLMKGGKHGKAILPDNAKESLLSQKLGPTPPFGKTMPPSKKLVPSAEQIGVLRLWIDQGAKKD